MKMLKHTAPLEKDVQEIEALMNSKGISIVQVYEGLAVYHNGKEYPIRDADSGALCISFPRSVDSERLEVRE